MDAQPPNQQAKRIIICFSPRDTDGKAELVAHLAPLRQNLSTWSIDDVSGGESVADAFMLAATGADAALLLLSSDFFAELDEPAFAEQIEQLRRQQSSRGLTLIPLVWRDCAWQAVSWLKGCKPLMSDGSALRSLSKRQRDRALADIVRQFNESSAIRSPNDSPSAKAFDKSWASGRKINIQSHIKRLKADLADVAGSISRILKNSEQHQIKIAPEPKHMTYALSNGDSLFIGGWSGRGKTTVLRMLALCALNSKPRRVPIFLIPDSLSDFPTLIRKGLKLSSVEKDDKLQIWLQRTPTLLLVDDWHRLSDDARRKFEEMESEWRVCPTALAIAGAESVRVPHIRQLNQLELGPYTPEQRDDAVLKALKRPFHSADWLFAELPEGLKELLCEPVLLARFLQRVRLTPNIGVRPPQDIIDLFRQLLDAIVASRHSASSRRADEIATVCCYLVTNASAPFDLRIINDALHSCGAAGSAGDFAEDMRAVGIWKQITSGLYVFDHEIWKSYFRSVALAAAGYWSTSAQIKTWIQTTSIEELHTLLPFATGLITNFSLQEDMYSELLKRDLKLYCRSLRTRQKITGPTEKMKKSCLQLVHSGYLELIDNYIPKIKPYLEPWIDGDGEEGIRGEKAVLRGTVDTSGISFCFGFAPPDVLDVDEEYMSIDQIPQFAPSKGFQIHNHSTRNGLLRADSGRLLGAQLLIKQLIELCKDGRLPSIAWIGRERFRNWAKNLGVNSFLPHMWQTLTVTKAVECIATLRSNYKDRVLFCFTPRDNIDPDEFISLGQCLIAEGHGETSIIDLGLPGPDLTPTQRGVYHNVELYSKEQALRRVRILYQAFMETYRQLCEQYFGKLKDYFWYAQCPCKPIIDLISEQTSTRPMWWSIYWEVVADWPTEPDISSKPEQRLGYDFHKQLALRNRQACERYGRKFLFSSVSKIQGDWGIWDDEVTRFVTDELRQDLERIYNWIARAS